MSSPKPSPPDWLRAMSSAHCRVTPAAGLAPYTWLRCGGNADWLIEPETDAALAFALTCIPQSLPVTVLGAGSNILVRDGGVAGIVIKLGRGFRFIKPVEAHAIHVGAAVPDQHLARIAARHSLGGYEFLIGIPGLVGGALRMNAGCHGHDISDRVIAAAGYDRNGHKHFFTAAEMKFDYRSCAIAETIIFTEAWLRGYADDSQAIRSRMASLVQQRITDQPAGARSGGSAFRNPSSNRAWQLIDHAGCRGLRQGDAMLSDKHCNFLVNLGSATAHDLEAVGETARSHVRTMLGVSLEWEIRILGQHLQASG